MASKMPGLPGIFFDAMAPFQRPRLDRWSAATTWVLLAAMVVLPFLHNWHFFPLPTFWPEWWAVTLGLLAALGVVVLLKCLPEAPIPAVVLIPGLLVVVLLIQLAAGRIYFPQMGLLATLYLLWAALMAVVGHVLAARFGLDTLARIIAPAIALGGLAAAAITLTQWAGGALLGTGLVFPGLGRAYGNLGQGNHQADYLWLAIASVTYLYVKKEIGRIACVSALVVLVFASVATGSRSILLYAVALALASGWMWRRDGLASSRAIFKACIFALLLIPFSQLVLNLLDLPGLTTSSLSRLYESVSSAELRTSLYGVALLASWNAPWLGNGFGEFPWQSFQMTTELPWHLTRIVAEHAHNIFLQLALEFGWLVVLAIAAILCVWFAHLFRQPKSPAWWWAVALVGVMGIHSQLEYPLWYAYFLGPFALLLGATDRSLVRVTAGSCRWYLALIIVAGLAVVGMLRSDFGKLEAAWNWPLQGAADREVAWRRSLDNLLALQKESLLAPWATNSFAVLIEPARDHVHERSLLCQQGMRVTPAVMVVTKCAALLMLDGKETEAKQLLDGALAAFPRDRAGIRIDLERYRRDLPELAPLLEMADHEPVASYNRHAPAPS